MTRLADLLAAAKGGPIDFEGQIVRMMHEVPEVTTELHLRLRMTSRASHPQGVVVKVRGGEVEINGQTSREFELWTETAPDVTSLIVRPSAARRPLALRFWNVWRDPLGVTQAWIGDAGMVVEEHGKDGFVLRCSDGFDSPDFDNLCVEVTRR